MMQKYYMLIDRFLNLDRDDQCRLSELLFFVPYGIWVASRILIDHTTFGGYIRPIVGYPTMQVVCLVVIAIREIMFGRWDRRTFIGFILFGYMAAAAIIADNKVVFGSICLVFAARNVDFRRIVRFSLVELSVIVMVTISASQIGLIPDGELVRGGVLRYHMGFAHPNMGPAYTFFIMCLWIYLRGRKFGIIDTAVMLAIAFALFLRTDSRTSFIASVAVILAALGFKFLVLRFSTRKTFLFAMRALILSSLVCAILGVILAVLYDPNNVVLKFLNSVMSSRLNLSHQAIEQYSLALMPRNVDMTNGSVFDFATGMWISTGAGGVLVDCAYVHLLVSCGVIFMFICMLLVTIANYHAYQNHQWFLLLVVCAISIHGLSESCCTYATYNAFLFLLGQLFYEPIPRRVNIGNGADHGRSSSIGVSPNCSDYAEYGIIRGAHAKSRRL